VAVLRAVASRKRPLVLFVDDLQWAGRTPLGFVDLVLKEELVEGLLLVGAYREDDVDAAHPLMAPLSRCREQDAVRRLRLANLPESGSVAMVTEMLHIDRAAAAGMVEVIGPCTSGNPYETVELLNALYRDGVLTATGAGWGWDEAAVRAHVGRSAAAGVLAARVEALPEPSRAVLEAMACLGGRAELTLLSAATGEPAGVVLQALTPAVEEGLLLAEPGERQAVRFHHDRMREEIVRGLDPRRRGNLQLAMARRLATVPELFAAAAEQYLPVAAAIDDAAERRHVVGLLRRAADQAALIGDYALMDALLAAALPLIEPEDAATLIAVRTGRHAALYGLGRLEDADEEYRCIDGSCATATARAGAAAVQVRRLTYRSRFAEAIALGIESLQALGLAVPAAGRLPADLDRQFGHLYRWLDHTDAADESARPDICDPALLATAHLLNAVLPACYVTDHAAFAWLSLEAMRIWAEHGPAPGLLGPVSHAPFAAATLRGDFAAGYRALQRILALGEARGYEPGTSQARSLFAMLACWFAPIETSVHEGLRARAELIAGGDLANAGYAYHRTVPGLLDCAPGLDVYVAEVEAGLAFVRRTGNEQAGQWLDSYQWLAGVLRGGTSVAEAVPIDGYAGNPLALFHAHLTRAIAAAIFGDSAGRARHAAAAMPLLPAALGTYSSAVAHVMHGIALAGQARTTSPGARSRLPSELDDVMNWLAARAADAPDNFRHLLRWLEAELAWALWDFRAAAVAFDAARREAAGRKRPWHQALITERAARFHLVHGLEQTGYDLLTQARQQYLAWGATAKVHQLDWAYPALQPHADTTAGQRGDQAGDLPQGRSTVTTGTLDLLGVLSASQALSSETNIDRLRAHVAEVLGAMTGATGVHLLLWSDDRHDWLLPAAGGAVPVSGTGHAHTVPMSVLRYAQRTEAPLVVDDATGDDRFARDPYFAGVDRCSLLALPVLGRGMVRAVLLLENRLIRGAFTAERLDAVRLIAGQLAVSLDNAQLYDELATSRRRIVTTADQTRRRIERDLHDGAQQRLVSIALQLRTLQAAPEATQLRVRLGDLATEVTDALDELRELARGIHPAILAEGGLRPALKGLVRRSAVPVELTVRIDRRLPEQIEIAAYYLVAEALTNVAKHAHASVVHVEAATAHDDREALRIVVHDDGRGGADLAGGSGLVGLKDRMEALGGRLSVQSAPHRGTTVQAELPLGPARAPG
jgi:signal transduction histidine kinase